VEAVLLRLEKRMDCDVVRNIVRRKTYWKKDEGEKSCLSQVVANPEASQHRAELR